MQNNCKDANVYIDLSYSLVKRYCDITQMIESRKICFTS